MLPRLLSGFYQLFDLYLVRHVNRFATNFDISLYLVTKQCMMMFGRQTFPVCTGLEGLYKREMLGDQSPSNIVWWPNILPFGLLVCCRLIVFDKFDKFEGHQTFDHITYNISFVLVFDGRCKLFVLMRACVPRLLSSLYQLFHLCLIKHVLTVWPLTSTSACLVAKHFPFDQVFGLLAILFAPRPLLTLHRRIPALDMIMLMKVNKCFTEIQYFPPTWLQENGLESIISC